MHLDLGFDFGFTSPSFRRLHHLELITGVDVLIFLAMALLLPERPRVMQITCDKPRNRLEQLPNEIVEHICSRVRYKRDLSRLGLCNRNLHTFVIPCLYRDLV